MKAYIITVAIAAIIVSATDILAPKEWEKYIKVIVGFLILSILLSPISQLRDIKLPQLHQTYSVTDIPLKDSVAEKLRQNIESDIEERIKSEFGIDSKAVVEIEVDSEHRITGVSGIRISCRKYSEEMRERIKEIYGCDKIEFKFE